LDHTVIIVGAGFSGIGMAIHLQKAGIDYVVLERSDQVGGTWRDNVYPGAACDVPSHLYCYSFELNARWSHLYARQPEILAYLRATAEKYGVLQDTRFGVDVTGARYEDGGWSVDLGDGTTLRSRFLVGAVGPLRDPNIPDLPGADTFKGDVMHSARWRDIDLKGKRVAVVGTGASAIQVIPSIVDSVSELHVFQRTPAWVSPRRDRAYTEAEMSRFSRNRASLLAHRFEIYCKLEARFPLLFSKQRFGAKTAEKMMRGRIARKVQDPQKAARLTPDYAIGCKRILVSDDYYPALNQDHVHVHGGAARITPTSVVSADGVEAEVDVIIYCTGFRVDNMLGKLKVYGEDGKEMRDVWDENPFAYLGLSVPRFPNFFLLLGPNTGLGHNSVIIMAEAQMRYIVQAVKFLERKKLATIEAKPAKLEHFGKQVDKKHQKLVWSSGCDAWYTDSNGHNFTIWPGTTLSYLAAMRSFKKKDWKLGA